MSKNRNTKASRKKLKLKFRNKFNADKIITFEKGKYQPKRKFFKQTVADLKKIFKEEDKELLQMNFKKLGVIGIFHHENGETNTARAFGAEADAIKAANVSDRQENLGYLCQEASKDNIINNREVAIRLLAYATQSDTFKQSSEIYGESGLIMNFHIEGKNYSCRWCNAMKFDEWIEPSRDIQISGGQMVA